MRASRDVFTGHLAGHEQALRAMQGDALYNVQVHLICDVLDVADRVVSQDGCRILAQALAARWAEAPARMAEAQAAMRAHLPPLTDLTDLPDDRSEVAAGDIFARTDRRYPVAIREMVTATGDFPAAPWLERDIPARDAAWSEVRRKCREMAAGRGMELAANEQAIDRTMLYMKTAGDGDDARAAECFRSEAEFVRLRLSVWAVPR